MSFGDDSEYLASVESARKQAKSARQGYAPIPNNKENELTKARLVSFKQLYDFNNLCLNKSFLRKRTKQSEDHISVLQDEVKELQRWRADLEDRMKKQFEAVDEHFAADDREFDDYKKKIVK